jgi:hypothetical protein
MESITDQGFIIKDGGNGKTEILINRKYLRGVFIGVRSSIKLGKIFTPENFEPYLCMMATLKYLLPEFANKLMMILKRRTNDISLGLIEAISPDGISRAIEGKISDYSEMSRIQLSTSITDPQPSANIKVNFYTIVGGNTPLEYVMVGPNEFNQTTTKII